MGPPVAAFPMIPSGKTIAIEAAAKAVSDMKRQKNNAGIPYATSASNEERLRRRSRKMAKDFQEAMEKNVKRKIDSMSGSQNNRKTGLKVAQFIPGKGLEVPGAQVENDPSIYCSLGIKGDKLVDPLDETFKRIKGRQVSMDFAFKLINNRDGLLTHDKKTRVTVMNCFRHVNPDSFNKDVTGWHETITGTTEVIAAKQKSNQNWNKTLGPDASLIRRATYGKDSGDEGIECGTWRGVNGDNAPSATGSYANTASNPSNTLMSPFRYPLDMEVMYSRVNRQLLENYSWVLNPFKYVGPFNNSAEANDSSRLGTPYVRTNMVWTNPTDDVLDFTKVVSSTVQSNKKASFPCQVNTEGTAVPASGSPAYEWHTQFGPGKLNYQFQNDGTNPVCIDICVVGIKKDTPVPVDIMESICKYNYAVHKFANKGLTNVNGFQSSASSGVVDESFGENEWHDNAKMPFMPDVCFKNPQSYLDAVDITPTSAVVKEVFDYLEQGKKNPFKVLKRDQFIVSSGSSRAWNTTLPSIKYRPQLYEDVEYPLDPQFDWTDTEKVVTTADEYSFVLCIGASGLPKPVEEVLSRFKSAGDIMEPDGTTTTTGQNIDSKAIIDRQPSTCNVSVVGTYKETIYPAFPEDRSSVNFINGRLTEPYFTDEPGKYLPSDYVMRPEAVNTVDIANLGQVVQVAQNGIIGVGALTTDIGA